MWEQLWIVLYKPSSNDEIGQTFYTGVKSGRISEHVREGRHYESLRLDILIIQTFGRLRYCLLKSFLGKDALSKSQTVSQEQTPHPRWHRILIACSHVFSDHPIPHYLYVSSLKAANWLFLFVFQVPSTRPTEHDNNLSIKLNR